MAKLGGLLFDSRGRDLRELISFDSHSLSHSRVVNIIHVHSHSRPDFLLCPAKNPATRKCNANYYFKYSLQLSTPAICCSVYKHCRVYSYRYSASKHPVSRD